MFRTRWYTSSLCLLLLLPLLVFSSEFVATNPYYSNCSEHLQCGNLKDFKVTYPFRLLQSPKYCGYPGYELNCNPDGEHQLTINLEGEDYAVLKIFHEVELLSVVDPDFMANSCPQRFTNTSINSTLFNYYFDSNLTVYVNCSFPKPPPDLFEITCLSSSGHQNSYYKVDFGPSTFLGNMTGGCDLTVAVPVYETSANELSTRMDKFQAALKGGFGLTWSHSMEWCPGCMNSGGICGYDESRPEDRTCFCPNTTRLGTCHPIGKGSVTKKVVIGLIAALVCFLLVCILLYFLISRHSRLNNFIFWKKNKIAQTIEAFLETCEPLGPKRYSYSALKKITKSFSEKLDQGGYGSVFKGKLPDGRLVAVKVLSDAKGNGDEFVNEVASIGRTSHINVVSLLGFSSEGSKRALIYEFMSNGSLEKYIYSENLKLTLGWEKLYQIAVGIAHGLEYLHRGCNTRIVHFDIKPHNILLDQDFCPKISDFGLAKLCLRKDSIFSAIDTRGTIGYIAPEVFSRNFGVVSSKSDVYSYGMMLLEMVGVRNTSHSCNDSRSSECYFPHWIYEHFYQIGHMERFNLTVETEEIAKKMILVGLWCIQTKPGSRPSMSKVVDMLQSSIDDLEIPPKPGSSSP